MVRIAWFSCSSPHSSRVPSFCSTSRHDAIIINGSLRGCAELEAGRGNGAGEPKVGTESETETKEKEVGAGA